MFCGENLHRSIDTDGTLSPATCLNIFADQLHPPIWHQPSHTIAASPSRTAVGPAKTALERLRECHKESEVFTKPPNPDTNLIPTHNPQGPTDLLLCPRYTRTPSVVLCPCHGQSQFGIMKTNSSVASYILSHAKNAMIFINPCYGFFNPLKEFTAENYTDTCFLYLDS